MEIKIENKNKRDHMNDSYTFSTFNDFADDGICQALTRINIANKKPIFICIGSDLVLGDSLGPLIGTKLKENSINNYIYGTLNFPITAKEIEYATTELTKIHKNCITVAIDAAVGCGEDVGLIKVAKKGLYPGLGVNKKLKMVGDVSIVGIVAGKSLQNYNLYNLTRLNLIYKMAEVISSGIKKYITCLENDFYGNNNYIFSQSK